MKIASYLLTAAPVALAVVSVPASAQNAGAAAAQSAPPQSRKADEVVVTGTRSDVVVKTDRLSFSVANDLQAQTGSIADALRNVPGVEVDVQGNVSLRGDSGVQILIDGRPSSMLNGASRADFLQSMPAGQIERVEVITNPSAAFSPEGSGGIINLVTKRTQAGSRWATARLIAGEKGRAGASLSGAVSSKGLTVTGDLGVRQFPTSGDYVRTRTGQTPGGDPVDTRQVADVDNVPVMFNSRLGLEYDLNKTNRISGEVSYRAFEVTADRDEFLLSDSPPPTFERSSELEVANRIAGGKVSWRKQFPGNEHVLVADLELERLQFERDIDGETLFADGDELFERIANSAERWERDGSIDYKRPIGEKSSLNVGLEIDSETNDFDFDGAMGSEPGERMPVAGLTNAFAYDQIVQALYATLQFPLGKLELQPGIRFEQADITIDQKTDQLEVENDYFRVYPTLHVNYGLGETQRLRASYSRRIQRPSPLVLNPYTFYIDPQNLRRGNPFLRPEITDAFELGWNRRKDGTFLSLTAFHRRSRDTVTEVVEDLGDGILLTTSANLGRSTRTGAEAIANGKIGKTLTYNASATLMEHKIKTEILNLPISRKGTTGSARLSLSWQPTAKDFFQLGGHYAGKQLLPQGYRLPGGALNLGYRRKVSDKLSLLLTAQDVLATTKLVTVVDQEGVRDRIVQKGPGRIVLAGLTYNFGTGNRRRQDQGIEFESTATPIP